MGLFTRKEQPKRSIEDILTPKGEEYYDDVPEGDDEIVEDEAAEREDNAMVTDTPKNEIRIETREESSFNALTCFGWSESRTPKWLIKCAYFWYWAISFMWFIFGAITFAPIIFIQKKVDVVFKDKFKSFICAAIIYVIFVGLLVLLFATRNADKAKEVVDVLETTVETSLDTEIYLG